MDKTKLLEKFLKILVFGAAAGVGITTMYFAVINLPDSAIKTKFEHCLFQIKMMEQMLKNYRKKGNEMLPAEVVIDNLAEIVELSLKEIISSETRSSVMIRILFTVLYTVLSLSFAFVGVHVSSKLIRKLLRLVKSGQISEQELQEILEDIKAGRLIRVQV